MRILIALLLFTACGKQPQASDKRDLNGPFEKADGTCISNIGHRVGGDFRGLKDNNPITARKVKHLELHKCFKAWEFDVNSAKDQLIVRHDYKSNGKYVKNIHSSSFKASWTLNDFMIDLMILNPIKPLAMDVKILTENHYDDLINHALLVRNNVDTLFLFHTTRVPRYQNLIKLIENNGFRWGIYK